MEWVLLILQAKGIGLKTEEVRFFLEEQKKLLKQ
nr:DNA-binding anti-repressor SinI [Oceanobacillus alkalisoli]